MHSYKPQHRPGSPAAVAHALLPTPPRGRRCPRGNRGLRSLLKPCWLPRDINRSLAAAWSSKLGAGAGPAPGTDTSALVGRTERASCPLSTLRLPPQLLPAASLQAVQVRGAGEARAWQRGCQGLARRGVSCRSVDSGHWLKPGCALYLALRLTFSGLHVAGPPGAAWTGKIPLLPLWSLSQLLRRPGGGCPRAPL